jgi:hypothetical protein
MMSSATPRSLYFPSSLNELFDRIVRSICPADGEKRLRKLDCRESGNKDEESDWPSLIN